MKNPGWVDLQVNGHNGIDYTDPNLTAEDFIRSAEELLKTGTDIFCPVIITSPLDNVRRNAEIIQSTVEKYGLQAHIPGLHLEGPFISNIPGAVGAHNPDYTLIPTAENVEKLLAGAPGFISIVTMGADAPGAPEAVALLKAAGVHVSTGHHMADYAQVKAMADAGAELLTHLGNGCPNLLDRHCNPVWAGLAEERLTAMLITDGHHLPAELVKVLIRSKGADKVIVTSDASSPTGLPPGRYETLGGLVAVLEANGKLHIPERKCLAGSASTMSMCMNFLDSLDFLTGDELRMVGRDNALKLLGKL